MLSCFLVEDSALIRRELTATLEELVPLRVVGTAEDADTALRWMAEPGARCDLMVIDIFLKTGTGLDVLRAARERQPLARRVVLSNFATPDVRRRCLALGADRVFDKSAELDGLLAYCTRMAQDQAAPAADPGCPADAPAPAAERLERPEPPALPGLASGGPLR